MKKILVFICAMGICGIAAFADAQETKGIGYWKNHDIERETYITSAVALSSVYDTESSMRYHLELKGKKDMYEHAIRHLAALLLNIAEGFQTATWLSQGELDIAQIADPTFVQGSSVGDALIWIENKIHCYQLPTPADCGAATTFDDLESAKDLAEEINNRGTYF